MEQHHSTADLAESTVRGAAWTAAAKWSVRMCTLLAFALLARLLAPTDFGQLAIASAVVEIARVVAQQGFAQSLIREPHVDRELISSAFWIGIAGSVVMAGALVLTAPVLAVAMGSPGLAPILQVLAGYLLLSGLGSVPEALLTRDMKFRPLATRTIASTLCGIATAIALALVGAGVWALVGQMMVQALVATALLWWHVTFRPVLAVEPRRARGLLRFGWTVALIDIGTAFLGQLDKIVIGAMLGEVAAGYYFVAFRMISILDELLLGVFSTLALPVFSRLQRDTAATIRALNRATRTTLTAAAPVYVSMFILAPLLIPLAFGPGWGPSAQLLQVFCVAGVLGCTMYFDRGVLLAAGRPGLELMLVTVFTAGTVVAAYLGSLVGLYAAALAVTVRMYITFPLRLVALRRVLALRMSRYLGQWVPAIAAMAVFVAIVAIVEVAAAGMNDWLRLPAATVLGLIGYVGLLLVVDRTFLVEIARLVRRAVGRRPPGEGTPQPAQQTQTDGGS